jgi:hypothetical protein
VASKGSWRIMRFRLIMGSSLIVGFGLIKGFRPIEDLVWDLVFHDLVMVLLRSQPIIRTTVLRATFNWH